MAIGPAAEHAPTSGGPVQATQGQVRGTIGHAGIIARGLSKRFGRLLAVDGIDLDFEPGAVALHDRVTNTRSGFIYKDAAQGPKAAE